MSKITACILFSCILFNPVFHKFWLYIDNPANCVKRKAGICSGWITGIPMAENKELTVNIGLTNPSTDFVKNKGWMYETTLDDCALAGRGCTTARTYHYPYHR
jgi:hypothetical protein